MKEAWLWMVPFAVALVAATGGIMLAFTVFGLLLGGSITATPVGPIVVTAALWGVGLGIGWMSHEVFEGGE